MFRLVAATDAQRRGRDALTWPEWGQALSLEQWLGREVALREHPWAMAAMESWLLVGDGGQTLASCETFRTVARLGDEPGDVYAVASVFTEPPLRGKGHATAMIDALNLELARRPRALGSVLFSDVGARIYQRSGYQPVGAREVVLPPAPGVAIEGVTPLVSPLPDPPPVPSQPGELHLLPGARQLDWHLERERFYTSALRRPGAGLHGARAGGAWACWVASLKEDFLRVLWLQPGTPEETAAVLRSAQRVAHASGVKSVRIWEPHPGFDGLPGERQERDGELPMVRLYGGLTLGAWRHVHRAVWV